jgi:hypothetical protein
MYKRVVTIVMVLILIAGCHSSKKNVGKNQAALNSSQKIYSIWHLKNRATGQYIFDDGSIFKSGSNPKGDAYHWMMETAGAFTRIKNKATGRYLTGNDAQTADSSSYWNFGGFDYENRVNCGWYWVKNRTGNYLICSSSTDLGFQNTDINKNNAAHWSFIRTDGSLLPFAIDSVSVREASFLGDKTATLISQDEIHSNYSGTDNTWVRTLDISRFPQLRAPHDKLFAALYNMALEESLLDIRKSDSTFMAGKLWPDTWTRDVVYSIYLAYSFLMPDIAKRTLEKQSLKNPDEALQDTGSGGSWPISTDRVSWAIAAWEYYLATGDKQWLEECYNRLRYTAEKDLHVAYNQKLKLFAGETCSMDWRTHTYPNWFSNANIGESYSTGTNSLHAFMYFFLKEAGTILNKPQIEISKWNQVYTDVRAAINDVFWLKDKGYFSSYILPPLYGYRATERTAGMDNGLAILLGVVDKQRAKQIIENTALYPYGAATLYPSIPDDYAYHNKTIWPVWETYFMLGAKKAGNEKVVEHIMQSLIRQSALFLTHKENMNYETGFNANTALNSDRQLWSVASYLGMVYRIVFGMDMNREGLAFHPLVPSWLTGPFELSNFKYRDAILNLRLTGKGNEIASLVLDGKSQSLPFIFPASMNGNHTIEIMMKKSNASESDKINFVQAGEDFDWSPIEPTLTLKGNHLLWQQEPGLTYHVWDGTKNNLATSPYKVDTTRFGIFSLYAVNAKGFASDVSEPIIIAPDTRVYQAEDAKYGKNNFGSAYKGFSGKGYVMDWDSSSSKLKMTIEVPAGKTGKYALQLRGANGHGPHGTFVAIRSVFVDGKDAGTFILEANGNWQEWTQSNTIILDNLSQGKHTVEIKFNPENKGLDNNMSHNRKDENDCAVDYLKVIRVN